jgi:hypothetical protein
MSVRARHSRDKQQQAMTTLPIAMDAIKAIANCNGRDQHNHRETPKRSQEEPLKCNKEDRDDQSQSHKVASLMNATRAL